MSPARRIAAIALLAMACVDEPGDPEKRLVGQASSVARTSGSAKPEIDSAPTVSPREDPPAAARAELRMTVGPTIREHLHPVERERYARAELEALFGELRDQSRALCRYRHGLDPVDHEAIAAFVTPTAPFINRNSGPRWNLIAGCWNFVRMNDRTPHRDFETVRAVAGEGVAFHCYGVGVMQPYIMSEQLGCTTMTMVDIDWRIHDVHWQLLRAWREGGLSEASRDESLSAMRTDWIAHLGAREDQPLSLQALCHPGVAEDCGRTLTAFDSRRDDPSLEQVTLAPAPLHEIPIASSAPGPRAVVVFLSNATERHFMKYAEFEQMLDRVGQGLEVGQRAYFIHHVGGRAEFGLYEMTRESDQLALRTVCRDPYDRILRGGSEPYETWFERKLGPRAADRGVPPCQRMWREGRDAR